MNIAAERNFGLWRGATSGHIRSDLDARSDNATGQKALSPEGFALNVPATALFVGRRPLRVFSLLSPCRRDIQGQNGNVQSFLTGC